MVNKIFKIYPKILLNYSLKTQLILGIVLVQSIFTFVLAIHQFQKEKHFLLDQSLKQSIGLVNSISVSAINPLLVNDFAVIEDLIKAYSHNHNVRFIEIYDENKNRVSYLNIKPVHDKEIDDEISDENEFTETMTVVDRTDQHLILSSPIRLENKNLGWIVLEINEDSVRQAIASLLKDGIFFVIVSLIAGYILSYLLALSFIGQVENLKSILNKFGQGDLDVRSKININNEIGQLGDQFNQMADQLTAYQVKMVSAAKFAALGEMAGGIAHEINNPLSIIHGKASFLKVTAEANMYNRDKFVNDVDKIIKTSIRISKIINGLRSFSRDGANEEPVWISFNKIIEDCLDLTSEKLISANIKLNLKYNKDIELLAVPVQLSQVFLNLISNSIDALTQLNDRQITIETQFLNNQLKIIFSDTGSGIPEQIRQKIMQPFFTTKEIGKGTGLGLSISKGIIEQHNGQFYYDDTAGTTQFVIMLPNYRVLPLYKKIAS